MKPMGFVGSTRVALPAALPAAGTARQLTDPDYARAAKFLGRSTDLLVGHNYDPRVYHEVQTVTWFDGTHFWYRDHDATGDHFLEMDATTGKVGPAFDQAKPAAALGKARGKPITAHDWPHAFDLHPLADGGLDVNLAGKRCHCDLSGVGVCTGYDARLTHIDEHRQLSLE